MCEMRMILNDSIKKIGWKLEKGVKFLLEKFLISCFLWEVVGNWLNVPGMVWWHICDTDFSLAYLDLKYVPLIDKIKGEGILE